MKNEEYIVNVSTSVAVKHHQVGAPETVINTVAVTNFGRVLQRIDNGEWHDITPKNRYHVDQEARKHWADKIKEEYVQEQRKKFPIGFRS